MSNESTRATAVQSSKIADTEDARKYIDLWHREHFPTDRTFTRYIMGGDPSRALAGDFAWQLARALEAKEVQPSPSTEGQPVPDSTESEPKSQLARRVKCLEGLVNAYGPKSLQYDMEHPRDGLNSADPEEVLRTARCLAGPEAADEPAAVARILSSADQTLVLEMLARALDRTGVKPGSLRGELVGNFFSEWVIHFPTCPQPAMHNSMQAEAGSSAAGEATDEPRLACTNCHSTKRPDQERCMECGHTEFKTWAEISSTFGKSQPSA